MIQTERISADGARVRINLPEEAGAVAWHGHTRLAGQGPARNYSIAPAGRHRAIPTKIFPGGSGKTYRRMGFDLILYEAADRSNSCLIWAGPYNEATTWFGGPVPKPAVLNSLVTSVTFTDSADGAQLTPRNPVGVQQYGTVVLGIGHEFLLMAKDARAGRDALPNWQGAVIGNSEVWKERLDLDPKQRDALAGTPLEWRYIYASPTSIFTIAFPQRLDSAEFWNKKERDRVTAVMAGLKVEWDS
ncbi:hypothetical protein [Streptosporangium sp. KLBMP 9127]|nr:hypothetical protein [Streptosporangium sp. KLBMP 9127]